MGSVKANIRENLARMSPHNIAQSFVNDWKVDMAVMKSKWLVLLKWTPVAVLLATVILILIDSYDGETQYIGIITRLAAAGFILLFMILLYWMQLAREYIIKKEGIGKKQEEVK